MNWISYTKRLVVLLYGAVTVGGVFILRFELI